jgi:hypothetical protein
MPWESRQIEYQNATHGCVSAIAFTEPFKVRINHLSEASCEHTDSDGFTKHVWKPKQPIPLHFEAVTVHQYYTNLSKLQIKYSECDPQAESWQGEFGGESLTLEKPNLETLSAEIAHASTLLTKSKKETERLTKIHDELVFNLQQKCAMQPNNHMFSKRQKGDEFQTCLRCGYKEKLVRWSMGWKTGSRR